jgi:K319-like protein/VCBS repeat protein
LYFETYGFHGGFGLKRAVALSMSFVLLLTVLSTVMLFASHVSVVNGIPTRAVTGNEKNSSGLMQSASFSTVEVWDSDDDGLDEIYCGGAGRSNPKTRGISAYEYVVSNSTWVSFGSGLPGPSGGEYYGALGLGDVNEDGNLDIVAPIPSQWYSTSTNAVEIWTSNSGGTFSKSHTFSPGKSTNEAEVADLDGDDDPDIVFSYYGGVKVYFGSGSATSWTEKSPTANGYEMDGVAAGDLNNDGLMDLIATPYFNTKKVFMYIQGSSRTWSEVTFKNTGSEAFGVKIADLNGDGNNDVIYGSKSEGIKVWGGNGGGSSGGTSFTWTDNSSGLPTGNPSWQQVELGDVDGDGDLDMIAISNGQDRARIFINNQPNAWTELFTSSGDYLTIGGSGYGANFADFDGDGDLDAVGASWGGGIDAYTIHSSTTTPPPPVNERPVPDAGDDIEVMLGETVNLDGTGSTDHEDAPTGDPAGDVLFYDWNVTSFPPGSTIRDSSLSPDENSAEPSFVPDQVGRYQLTLRVRDPDDDWSEVADTDTVGILVNKPNDPPVADAGIDQSGYVGDEFTLDGSGSSDIDGSITAYEWSCTSHTVSFTGQETVTARFTTSEAGTYIIQLRSYDDNDTWSDPDEMQVLVLEVWENLPPTANAGPDQDVLVGELVTLDGSRSSDADGSIVEWEWTSTTHPSLVFTYPNSSSPDLTPSEDGDHSIRLRVRDDNDTWSTFDSVLVTVTEPYVNPVPVANAGPDQDVQVGDTVTLDGRGSSDSNGFIVRYNWSCTSHTVTLIGGTGSTPSFIPIATEDHIFTLTVSDDEDAWSVDDTVVIHVSPIPVVETFDITIGPFSYDDNTVLSGATVLLVKGDLSWTQVTDSSGEVTFDDLEAGAYKCKVEIDGKDVISLFDVTIGAGGFLSIPGGLPKAPKEVVPVDDDDDTEPVDDDDDTGSSKSGSGGAVVVVVIIVVLLFIAAGVVGFFIFMKNKDEDEETDDDPDVSEKECSNCNVKMDYNEDFKRYKCPDCGRYQR